MSVIKEKIGKSDRQGAIFNMKKAVSIILAALAVLLCTSCDSDSDTKQIKNGNDYHTLYYKDVVKRDEVCAVFVNNDSEETEEVEMTAVDEGENGFTYSCEGDVSSYDTVYFRYDGFNTAEVAFNRCVSGWYNTDHGFLPYAQGADDPYESRLANSIGPDDTIVYNNAMYDDVTLTFNGYDKVIHIWTPDDYDPTSDEKYATVYLLDGQVMIYLGFPGETLLDSEHADVQVQSMTATTGYKAIVVAVDTFGDIGQQYSRLDEMVPDLGELAYDEETQKCGTLLSDFLADTAVPYVRQHYNVYTDALHTSVVGKSLGGLEAFYTALEHPDIFGTAGVLSPSFMLYTDDTWRSYLSEKIFDDRSPFLYFYSGNEVEDNGDVTDEMVARIKELGYPDDRFAYHREKIGGHEAFFWRSIFSEFLEAMVYQRVSASRIPFD